MCAGSSVGSLSSRPAHDRQRGKVPETSVQTLHGHIENSIGPNVANVSGLHLPLLIPAYPDEFFFFKILFIHDRHTHRQREREGEGQREKQAPCRGPDVGLDPWTPGSHPGPKAGARLLSHPGIPS